MAKLTSKNTLKNTSKLKRTPTTILDRSLRLNQSPYKDGPVLYWMYRDQRVEDNWALLRAQEIALERKQALIVVVAIREDLRYAHGTSRWFEPMIAGLQEVSADLVKKQIGFAILIGDPEKTLPDCIKRYSVGAVVCDFSPLRFPRLLQRKLAESSLIAWEVVDAHNCIPTWIASPKQEFAARTFRPKVHALLPDYLVEFPKVKKHPFPELNPEQYAGQHPEKHPEKLSELSAMLNRFYSQTPEKMVAEVLARVRVNTAIRSVAWFKPGEQAGQRALETFFSTKLSSYASDRNDPTKDGLSNLSPYLHFGHLAPARVALELQNLSLQNLQEEHPKNIKSELQTKPNQVETFFEEVVIRRELTDNFCFYSLSYDSIAGAPAWAQKTLEAHALDDREFIYSYTEFEQARTHDAAWNAAQIQLLTTGKMHGYMRMYWAKKILEWSKSPEEAIATAIQLNDEYELDGRDPNGYVGVLWSIAGLHDRPWFERPVYGTIRYMNANGLKRKFDLEAYITQYTTANAL